MKTLFLCILLLMGFIVQGIVIPKSIKPEDIVAYTAYVNYCDSLHPYTTDQHGRTTYDHFVVVKNDVTLGNEKVIKAGTKEYFYNEADTVWYPADIPVYMENSLKPLKLPLKVFKECDPNNGTLALETLNSPRFKILVTEVQKCLVALGYPITVDGKYGTYTARAMSRFVADSLYMKISYSTQAYPEITNDMLVQLKNKAYRTGNLGVNVNMSIGKMSAPIVRETTGMIPKRRHTVDDFLNGYFRNGKIYDYFKNLK